MAKRGYTNWRRALELRIFKACPAQLSELPELVATKPHYLWPVLHELLESGDVNVLAGELVLAEVSLGGDAAVLAALGPDFPSAFWARRLDLPEHRVRLLLLQTAGHYVPSGWKNLVTGD